MRVVIDLNLPKLDMEGGVTQEGEATIKLDINGNMSVQYRTRFNNTDPGAAIGMALDQMFKELRKPLISR